MKCGFCSVKPVIDAVVGLKGTCTKEVYPKGVNGGGVGPFVSAFLKSALERRAEGHHGFQPGPYSPSEVDVFSEHAIREDGSDEALLNFVPSSGQRLADRTSIYHSECILRTLKIQAHRPFRLILLTTARSPTHAFEEDTR